MRTLSAAAIVLGLVITSAAAQDLPRRPTSAEEDANAVIIVGCLLSGPSGYALTRITQNHPAHEGPDVHPVGTTAADPASAAVPSYTLSGKRDIELKEHLGKKVELTGVLLRRTNDITREAANARAGNERDEAKRGGPAPLAFAVTSVKPIASACQ